MKETACVKGNRYLKLNYHDRDYVDTGIVLAKRIIHFYDAGLDYGTNRSSFARMFTLYFSDRIEQLEQYVTEAFKYYYLADYVLQGNTDDGKSVHIFNDDYKVDCCFTNDIDPYDNNSETIYIDIGVCKYYIL